VGAGDEAVGKSALTQMFQSKGAVFPKNYKMVRPSLPPPQQGKVHEVSMTERVQHT
jgi:hypothetical protein